MSSIRKQPSGRWRARYRDEANKEHARHFERKVDAQRWIDEVTASVVTGAYVDPGAGRITFRQFHDQWAARQVWKPGTVAAVKLAAYSVGFLDDPIASVRRSHLEAWVQGMDARGLAAGTIRTRYVNVRGVFRAAVADRVIASDPTDRVRLPRRRKSEAAMRIPTPEQVGEIVGQAGAGWGVLFAVCAFAGLRLGEAAALQAADIDFLRRTIHVRRQVQRVNGGGVDVRAPKYESERVVFVPEALTDLLAGHIAADARQGIGGIGRVESGTDRREHNDSGGYGGIGRVESGTGYLIRSSGDLPAHQNTVGHQWRLACKAAKVSGVRLHDLRHFYASGLIASGCDVVTVQRALGHASATTTLATYSHLWPDAEDRTRSAAAALMAESLKVPADCVRTAEDQ
jgi:integrase